MLILAAGSRRRARTRLVSINVLHLNHGAQWSGGEIALVRLFDAVDPDLVTHTLICAEAGPLVDAARKRGVRTAVLPLTERVRAASPSRSSGAALAAAPVLLAYATRIARLARKLGSDVIHTNSLKAHLYGTLAGRLAGVPVVAHLRDDLDAITSPRLASVVRTVLRHGPSRLVACSGFALRSVCATADPARVIYSGVPAGDVVAEPPDRDASQVVGMVARIAPWKGQHLFLDAAAKVARECPDVRFRVVGAPLFGEERYFERLRAVADGPALAGRVEFRGFVSDPRGEFDELSVAVATSVRPEPLGQVVIEAMARGVPAVAPREGGPLEIVTSGSDGLLVPPRDPDALAGAVLRLLDDPHGARRLAREALRTVRDRFTVEANATRFTAILEEAAA